LEKLPWLDYTGQTTPELIACKGSHRIDSLLCAFEEGIQAKLAPQSDGAITDEEELVLAVMALNREVNNGGHHQFFVNSSRQFAPIIVDCLRRIDCVATAAITEKAIAARELPGSDEILHACDREFYQLNEITPNLFRFVEAHQDQIQLVKASLPPRPPRKKLGNASRIYVRLSLAKKTVLTLDDARQLARELAARDSIPATDAELEGAAVQHAFNCALGTADFAACEALAPRVFELMREDPLHSVLQRKYVEKLIEASRLEQADASMLTYLEYLKSCDQSTLSTQNRILYWAALLKMHRAALPKSVEFFIASFPRDDLNKPLPRQRFAAEDRPAQS
jgi:uncharacterized protein DUF4375